MNVVRYSAEWRDDAPNVAPEERHTVADFRLWLDQRNVAMHLRGSNSFDYLTISLYSLAEGLAHDWWSLFGGRDREVSLIAHRSGYAVPDIRLKFDGAVFEIAAHQRTYLNPDVRFWAGLGEVMSREQAEAEIGGFVEFVLQRLASKGVRDTSAALRWARVRESRATPAEAQFCESAGALGLDPYQIQDSDADLIERAASIFEGEPLSEFLAGAKEFRPAPLLEWLKAVERRPPNTSTIGDLREVASATAEQSPARVLERGWSLGYRRARAMRRALDLGTGDRFPSFKDLARRLGASESYDLAASVDGIRALRSDHNDEISIHIRNHGYSEEAFASHLFTFARAIGDVACFPEHAKAPINELRSANRQAAGRAFAAEFLAPIDEIESMRQDGHDVVSMADEFAVSTVVIERQIENSERIRATLLVGDKP
jgi:hypothetical protein